MHYYIKSSEVEKRAKRKEAREDFISHYRLKFYKSDFKD
jgi:hypothetical protein